MLPDLIDVSSTIIADLVASLVVPKLRTDR